MVRYLKTCTWHKLVKEIALLFLHLCVWNRQLSAVLLGTVHSTLLSTAADLMVSSFHLTVTGIWSPASSLPSTTITHTPVSLSSGNQYCVTDWHDSALHTCQRTCGIGLSVPGSWLSARSSAMLFYCWEPEVILLWLNNVLLENAHLLHPFTHPSIWST